MVPEDRRLLRALQRDARRSLNELAEEVSLSTSACHRRIRALERNGAIEGYFARINPEVLGLEVDVVVEISLSSQSQSALAAFEKAVANDEQILECHLMAGQADYILRVAARTVADYETIHRNSLSKLPGVAAMHSSFVLRTVKPWRGYPVAPV